ncbi:MAG: uracil-DNA glycosylase family protein [Candidatus Hydrogenedentes bacterium]|nr:uracil-DNA glycosylase family protein [Candidatus Hydrogenedentota bacterium]
MNEFPKSFLKLVEAIRNCEYCRGTLPLGPNPVLRVGVEKAPILIVGQAPGLRVHQTKLPWNDPSGDKLRQWLGVSREQFYDTRYFTIIPAGFCYPGRNERGGDLPPRQECRKLWWDKILEYTIDFKLILLMGEYAQKIFLGERIKSSLRDTVFSWREYYPPYLPCPHPSFRNNLWLKRNPWFLEEVVPFVRTVTHRLINEVEAKK